VIGVSDPYRRPSQEQDDEWQLADGRYFSVGSMAKVDALEGGETPGELLAAIA
jgi:hypothetical protein